MKYLLHYTAVDGFLPLARENGAAHSARAQEFAGRGELLMIGVLDEPMNGEALAVFTSRKSAE